MPDICIDAVQAWFGTTVAPAGGAFQVPFSLVLAHEGPSGVTLARIFSPTVVTSTQHGIIDCVIAHTLLALVTARVTTVGTTVSVFLVIVGNFIEPDVPLLTSVDYLRLSRNITKQIFYDNNL